VAVSHGRYIRSQMTQSAGDCSVWHTSYCRWSDAVLSSIVYTLIIVFSTGAFVTLLRRKNSGNIMRHSLWVAYLNRGLQISLHFS